MRRAQALSESSFGFVFVGGDPAVDFVNTVVVESAGPADKLVSDAHLLAWARAAGLGVPDRCLREAKAHRLHAGVRPLRAALRALLLAQAEGRPPSQEALERLNARLGKARRGAVLVHGREGFRRRAQVPRTAAEVLGRVAELAAKLLCGPDAERLGSCAHARCVLLFVDRSRGRRRRWCSMEVCGNRAKVAAFQRRAREEESG